MRIVSLLDASMQLTTDVKIKPSFKMECGHYCKAKNKNCSVRDRKLGFKGANANNSTGNRDLIFFSELSCNIYYSMKT